MGICLIICTKIRKNKAGTTRNTNQENVAYAKPGKCLYNTLIMEEWETIAALWQRGSTKYVIHERKPYGAH